MSIKLSKIHISNSKKNLQIVKTDAFRTSKRFLKKMWNPGSMHLDDIFSWENDWMRESRRIYYYLWAPSCCYSYLFNIIWLTIWHVIVIVHLHITVEWCFIIKYGFISIFLYFFRDMSHLKPVFLAQSLSIYKYLVGELF